MARLSVDRLQPGMRTATPVTSPQGRRLLEPGVELNESHLRLFRAWGVQVVEVMVEEEPLAEDLPREVVEQWMARLRPHFPNPQGEGFPEALLKEAARLRARREWQG